MSCPSSYCISNTSFSTYNDNFNDNGTYDGHPSWSGYSNNYFIYYKTELPDSEFEKYNQYNFYYLSGLYKAQLATIKAQETKVNETEQKLLDLDAKINKTLNAPLPTPEINKQTSNIPIPSPSFKTINQLNLTPMNDDENTPFSFLIK